MARKPPKVFRQSGKRNWYYMLTIAGKRRRLSTGTSEKNVAENIARKAKEALSRRTTKAHVSTDGITLSQAMMNYATHIITNRGTQKSTIKRYSGHARSLETYFGSNCALQTIRSSHVRAHVQHQLTFGINIRGKRTGKGRTTVIHELSYLRSVVRHAIREGHYLGENFVDRIDIKKTSSPDIETLDDDEITLIKVSVDMKAKDYLPDMIDVAVLTGLRKDELTSLHTDQVDLKRRTITFSAEGSGKARRQDTIPICSRVTAILQRRQQEQGRGKYFPYKRFEDSLATAVKRAGITKRVTPHIFRHTFATNLARKGATHAQLKRLVRHASDDMVNRYLHLAPNDVRHLIDD